MILDFSTNVLLLIAVDSHESIPINASRKCCSTEWGSSQKSFNLSGHPQLVPSSQFDYCTGSETTSTSINGAYSLKMRVSSSTSGSCSGTSRASHCGTLLTSNGSSKNFGLDKRPNFNENAKLELLEDSLDPFAFDEDEFEPSKWDLLSGKQRKSKTRKSAVRRREFEDGYPSQLFMSQEESSNGENSRSHELSPPTAVDEAGSSLLADCLLTTVKVFPRFNN